MPMAEPTPTPTPTVQDIVEAVCAEYENVDPLLVRAIIKVESGGDPLMVGDGGWSVGLMQINTAAQGDRIKRLGVDDLFDPESNIRVGVDYLAALMDEGKGQDWALLAYNGGGLYADSLIRDGITETVYTCRVLNEMEVLSNHPSA